MWIVNIVGEIGEDIGLPNSFDGVDNSLLFIFLLHQSLHFVITVNVAIFVSKIHDSFMKVKRMPGGFLIANDKGISIENTRLFSNMAKMLKADFPEIISVVVAYESCGLYLASDIDDGFGQRLIKWLDKFEQGDKNSSSWNNHQIPVCYDYSICADLESFCTLKNMTLDTLIDIHSRSAYFVAMIGFLPGFLYLGGLSEELSMPRKDFAVPGVRKGAVAIGGSQTGIYPSESPGGWHVIGITPLNIFDVSKANPSNYQAGDLVRFNPISLDEYKKWND